MKCWDVKTLYVGLSGGVTVDVVFGVCEGWLCSRAKVGGYRLLKWEF